MVVSDNPDAAAGTRATGRPGDRRGVEVPGPGDHHGEDKAERLLRQDTADPPAALPRRKHLHLHRAREDPLADRRRSRHLGAVLDQQRSLPIEPGADPHEHG